MVAVAHGAMVSDNQLDSFAVAGRKPSGTYIAPSSNDSPLSENDYYEGPHPDRFYMDEHVNEHLPARAVSPHEYQDGNHGHGHTHLYHIRPSNYQSYALAVPMAEHHHHSDDWYTKDGKWVHHHSYSDLLKDDKDHLDNTEYEEWQRRLDPKDLIHVHCTTLYEATGVAKYEDCVVHTGDKHQSMGDIYKGDVVEIIGGLYEGWFGIAMEDVVPRVGTGIGENAIEDGGNVRENPIAIGKTAIEDLGNVGRQKIAIGTSVVIVASRKFGKVTKIAGDVATVRVEGILPTAMVAFRQDETTSSAESEYVDVKIDELRTIPDAETDNIRLATLARANLADQAPHATHDEAQEKSDQGHSHIVVKLIATLSQKKGGEELELKNQEVECPWYFLRKVNDKELVAGQRIAADNKIIDSDAPLSLRQKVLIRVLYDKSKAKNPKTMPPVTKENIATWTKDLSDSQVEELIENFDLAMEKLDKHFGSSNNFYKMFPGEVSCPDRYENITNREDCQTAFKELRAQHGWTTDRTVKVCDNCSKYRPVDSWTRVPSGCSVAPHNSFAPYLALNAPDEGEPRAGIVQAAVKEGTYTVVCKLS